MKVLNMRLKHLTSACLVLLLSLLMSQCTFRKSAAQSQGQSGPSDAVATVATDDEFAAALRRAQQSAKSDGLGRAFEVESKISIAVAT